MKPREKRETGQSDLFKARLDQIVDMSHPLVKLAATINWGFLEQSFGAVYNDGPCHQGHGCSRASLNRVGAAYIARQHHFMTLLPHLASLYSCMGTKQEQVRRPERFFWAMSHGLSQHIPLR